MIPRTLATYLRQAIEYFPVVACLGPRQSGKTTLVRETFGTLPYVSLENLDTRDFALSDPRGFLAAYPHGAVFDEVQRTPQLLSYLQGIVDEAEKQISSSIRFVLTGSHNFLLHQALTQSLAGRVALTTLLPFSLEELHSTLAEEHNIFFQNYEQLIWSGTYPRILAGGIPANQWLPNYIATYVERDVRQIQAITDLAQFTLFLKMCAGRTGQILNLSAMANECGISPNTAKAWIHLLEASYILFKVPPYHQNFNKRLIKAPKLYFYDTGLACSLLGIQSPEQVESHFARGALFETMIIAEIKKWFFHRGKQAHVSYWRDSNGNEIDLLCEYTPEQGSARRIAFEIKSGRTISSSMFKNLLQWQSMSGDRAEDSLLIYGGDEEQKRSAGHVVSWRHTTNHLLR